MNVKVTLLAMLTLSIALTGCKKKEDTTIIVRQSQLKPQKPKATEQMTAAQWSRTIDWLKAKYQLKIERKPDKSLPLAKDESGQSYYDNAIHLTITRQDGSIFLDKVFHKDDLKQYVPKANYDNGALLGLVFDRVKDGLLCFGTSVGSPDPMSDEYVPLSLKIDRNGGISISKLNDLDGSEILSDEDEP